MALAGLLTYSPFSPAFPAAFADSGPLDGLLVMELTAAGQLWNYTIFPFNSRRYTRRET